ncbi:BAG domain-containing protein [Geopyxis carbonaria]|nr:BAG domain-containing protein [Geopyxis carbonaria]
MMRRFFGMSRNSGVPSYRRPISGNDDTDPHRAEDVITVKYGPNEYLFKYPVNTIQNHALNVSHVREKCAEITKVDYNRLNLVCAGHKLTDDTATLKTIGIEHGAKILCIGSNAKPPQRPQSANSSTSSQNASERKRSLSPLELIESVRSEVSTHLLPLVDEFIAHPPAEQDKKEDKHRRLSETIMAELLKLDSVESPEPEVRSRRKEVVREIQDTLDKLDHVVKSA